MEEQNRQMQRILTTVEHRQREIGAILDTVVVSASRNVRFAAMSKVITIVIGAFIATSGAAQILFGGEHQVVLVSYTLLGVAIAAVVALSTAFRFDERSSGLNRLGVDCRSAMLDLHYRYHRLCIFNHLLLIGFKLRLQRFFKRYRFRRNHVTQRATLITREY